MPMTEEEKKVLSQLKSGMTQKQITEVMMQLPEPSPMELEKAGDQDSSIMERMSELKSSKSATYR